MLGAGGTIRWRITVGTSLLFGATLLTTLLVVNFMQRNSADKNLELAEKNIITSMDRSGKILTHSHGLVMGQWLADEANEEIQSLVASAVKDDGTLLYGLVVDADSTVVAFSHPQNETGDPDDDETTLAESIEALGAPGEEKREVKLGTNRVFEYSRAIEADGETVGYIRYGFDNKAVVAAVEQERERQSDSLNLLLLTLIVITFAGLGIGWIGSGKLVDQLVASLNEMVDTVRDIAEGEGDLTRRVATDGAGEIGELATCFNTFLNHLQVLIRGVGETTMTLADASGNLTDTSNSMTQNASITSEQASQVNASASLVSDSSQNAAAAAEQMQSTIGEIARNANQAADVAMMGVQTVSDANQTVEKLGESSADIGKIINVITSIAEQTNLLALNATIEAARAGDAGKGFAVVASEVKDLAGETGKATTEISHRIEAIQKDALEAMTAIGHISAVINEINELQGSIAASVEQQSQTMITMTTSVHGAAEASMAITENISVVAETAASTMSGAEQAGGASESLREISFKMDDLIERFKYE
ncbi:MAG: methyl-accepting chemotaxis protein [Deltaproteobacteria bacterium]|nr:methyl-accepting chemotaxis protein [Deltaproteobacteria bacterium]